MHFITYFWVSISSPVEVLLPTIFILFIQVSKSHWKLLIGHLGHMLNRAARGRGRKYLIIWASKETDSAKIHNQEILPKRKVSGLPTKNYKVTIAY